MSTGASGVSSATQQQYQGWASLGTPLTLEEGVRRCFVNSICFRTFCREAVERWLIIHPETPAPIGMAEGMEREMLEAFYRGYFSR